MGMVERATQALPEWLRHERAGMALGRLFGTKVTWQETVWTDYYTCYTLTRTGIVQSVVPDNPYARLVWDIRGKLIVVAAVRLTVVEEN